MFFPDDDYTITWSDGVFDLRERTGLEVGIYRVDITDGSGCERTATFMLEGCFSEVYTLDEETGEPLFVGYTDNFEDFEVKITGGLFLEGDETSELIVLVRREGEEFFEFADPAIYERTKNTKEGLVRTMCPLSPPCPVWLKKTLVSLEPWRQKNLRALCHLRALCGENPLVFLAPWWQKKPPCPLSPTCSVW